MQWETPDTILAGTAGGPKTMPVYQLSDIQLQIGNAAASLDEINGHTETTFEDSKSELGCRNRSRLYS
jgi:hypothetical protein